MPYRRIHLVEAEIYHIVTRSIAGFRVFNSSQDFHRILDTMVFYVGERVPSRFSFFKKHHGDDILSTRDVPNKIVNLLCYCFMPTHIHLVLQQLKRGGISKYMNLILKSYAMHFNLKHNRKGPLWEGRFKNILVETDEQLLHLTRYIHLNPTSSSLVNKPEDWRFSSYREYINIAASNGRICDFSGCMDIDPVSYREFVDDRIDYQRYLEKIKHLILE